MTCECEEPRGGGYAPLCGRAWAQRAPTAGVIAGQWGLVVRWQVEGIRACHHPMSTGVDARLVEGC